MRIITAIDFSDATDKVIEQAINIATACRAEVLLTYVARPDARVIGLKHEVEHFKDEASRKHGEEYELLEEYAERLRESGVETLQCMLRGDCVEELLEQASDQSADMIILGSHGDKLAKKLFLGSVSEDMVRKSAIPLLLVPIRDDQA